ncbi:hypothetical protein PC121_g2319 [Phytophthora cactorum]|nr:hypothetical protein PC120_g1658 [Phytophthora cactorum]KAG3097075.1 hypothetical protein PC121_g2319 [Phytophthora cactorum]KAG4062550.1 hypothetical protein PC123_g2592 [Phytophthora cactorum]
MTGEMVLAIAQDFLALIQTPLHEFALQTPLVKAAETPLVQAKSSSAAYQGFRKELILCVRLWVLLDASTHAAGPVGVGRSDTTALWK